MNEFHLRFEQARDKDFWRQLNPTLKITDSADKLTTKAISIDPKILAEAKESLIADGYFQITKLLNPTLISKLGIGVENIFKAGWPTPFVVVYDEYWELFYSLKQLFDSILGEEFKQLPNFWCWYIDTNKDSKGWGQHRDRPSVNSVLETGLPATLTTWIPLSKATTANGCIYIVPSSRDPNYPPGDLEQRDVHELQNIRALPADEGDVLAWSEALLHWGSRSSNKAENARISISFAFQRADLNPYEMPLFDPSRYQRFDERLGLIGQNVCNYQSQGKTTPEILFACRRISGLIPPIIIQDGDDREVLETDKRLSDSMLWKLQEQYFESELRQATRGDKFDSTNKMTFVESYVELVTKALIDCAPLLDYESPQYILELGGGSGCFAYRFLHELAENKQDFEFLTKLKIKYVLTDFSEAIVKEWRADKNLTALVNEGLLDFAVFRPQVDKTIKLLVSEQVLTSHDMRNPLIVIANHVFDNIEQDAFRVLQGVLQESQITLYRDGKKSSLTKDAKLNEVQIAERFLDASYPYYSNPICDSILEDYRSGLDEATLTFPIGAIRCFENLSELCAEKLILISADRGFVRTDGPETTGIKPLNIDRDGSFYFDLNFDAIQKYFEANDGTSLAERKDYSGLRVMFNSNIPNRFQGVKHFFRHQLEKKGFLDSQYQIADLIGKGLTADVYDTSRVPLFLSLVRNYNYDPVIFATAHKVLLDERFQDLEAMNAQITSELLDTLHRTIRNIFLIDNDYKIFDSILRLYIQLDWFEECLKFCEEIIATYGEVSTAIDHAALSCEALNKHRQCYEYFQRATKLPTSDYEWAKAGMLRATKHLIKDGDSIVKVSVARAK